MHVSAPASSANLGSGFDCLAVAVDLPFELTDEDPGVEGFLVAEPQHPAAAAFVAAEGPASTTLWWRSPIPPGRGLGFSGAARVAGAYLAGRVNGSDDESARRAAMGVASRLEGHADNAAASTYGGFTVAVDDRVAVVPVQPQLAEHLRLLVWSPQRSTSTDASRLVLDAMVAREDAAFSIARSALWVAALATGDVEALRTACEDRLHQDARFAARPDARAVHRAAASHPLVRAAWLSGSGPSVAMLVLHADAAEVGSFLGSVLDDESGDRGRVRDLALDHVGVHELVG